MKDDGNRLVTFLVWAVPTIALACFGLGMWFGYIWGR
jgi:hypothetical protein